MTWLLSSLVWLILSVIQFAVVLLFRALLTALWLFWPVVLFGVLVATPQSAEAGWFSWLWGSGTRELERSLNVAQEAARVASQAAEAQATQAAAQADQNSRIAEAVAQLSAERQDYAGHLRSLSESALWDSQLAAVLNASGPVLICVFGLMVAGLALWLATRSEGSHGPELPGAVEVLLEELATGLPEGSRGQDQQGIRIGRASDWAPRLPLSGPSKGSGGAPEDESEMPF